jgi:hypothetical protein
MGSLEWFLGELTVPSLDRLRLNVRLIEEGTGEMIEFEEIGAKI